MRLRLHVIMAQLTYLAFEFEDAQGRQVNFLARRELPLDIPSLPSLSGAVTG